SLQLQELQELQGSRETPPLQESRETPPPQESQETPIPLPQESPPFQELSLTFTHSLQEPPPILIHPLQESQSISTHPLQETSTHVEYPSTTPSLTAQMTILSNDIHIFQREYLPSYYSAIKDMPPVYNPNAIEENSTTITIAPNNQNETFQLEPHHRIDPFQIFEPIQPQENTLWAKRCVCNIMVVLAIFIYIIVSLSRTDGRWV
ncbi:14515_t:CDS:2, partial [Dentiscutata heterogama]